MSYKKDRNTNTEENPEIKDQKDTAGQEGKEQDETGQEEKFSFLQETIKPRPLSREKILKELARIAVYGVILGIFACLGFFALRPFAQSWFQGDPKTVTIPEDEEPEEEQTEDQQSEEPVEQVLDIQSYEELMESMDAAAQEAQKGTATVSRTSAQEDWAAEATGIKESVAGVITADNGQELLVLAEDSICADAKSWTVTFSDGSEHEASLKKRDRNSGFAMFSVPRSDISDATWNAVKVAVLGNSNLAKQGDPVIALGNTFGYPDGVGYGVISSSDYRETFYDSECDVLATDISSSADGTGILFNLEGEVIGMISPSIWEDKEDGTANAYAVSDLKSVIELLANGESVPYIGVYGTAVTGEIQKEQGLPSGVYVIDVDPDSPAMAAGIQSGDIIWQVSGESVSSMVTYHKAVLELQTGEQVSLKGKRLGSDGYVDVDFTVTVGSRE